jgi:hypothetical protein
VIRTVFICNVGSPIQAKPILSSELTPPSHGRTQTVDAASPLSSLAGRGRSLAPLQRNVSLSPARSQSRRDRAGSDERLDQCDQPVQTRGRSLTPIRPASQSGNDVGVSSRRSSVITLVVLIPILTLPATVEMLKCFAVV